MAEDRGVQRLAETVGRLRRELAEARSLAEGPALMELAKGVLMERLRCAPTDAARQLKELAEQLGVSPVEAAADIVNRAAPDRLGAAVAAAAEAATPVEPAPAVRLRSAESAAVRAEDAVELAESLLAHALAPLGATGAAIWAVRPDRSLALAGYAGFTEEEAAGWHSVPPGVATVAQRALADRALVWFTAGGQTGPPSLGGLARGARAAAPVLDGGRLLGALEVAWPRTQRDLPPPTRRQIGALAELCVPVLDTRPPTGEGEVPRDRAELVAVADVLLHPALVLVPEYGPEQQLVDFRIHHTNPEFADPEDRPAGEIAGATLLEAYPAAAGPGGLFEQAEHVLATGEAFHGQRQALATESAEVGLARHGDALLLSWRIPGERERLAGLLQHAQRLGRIGGFEEDSVSGEVIWSDQLYEFYGMSRTSGPVPLRRLSAYAHPDDREAVRRFIRTVLHHGRPASTTFRLRLGGGGLRHLRVVAEPVLGRERQLLAVRGVYQDVSALHWTEVALAATRTQLVDTAQESAERNRLALQLQHAIMPPTPEPVDVPGLEIAVRYRPAGQEHLVGGDWYDTVVLPGGDVLLCVGDMAGHGIDAATRMVLMRNALRGLGVTGAGPGRLLHWLNIVAHMQPDHATGTAVCALYNPETKLLCWASAGHLPPVLLRDGRAEELPLINGLLLGALGEAAYEEAELQLRSNDTLLLYTDGLVERRDQSVEQSIRHFLRVAEEPSPTLESRLDHLLDQSNADTDDDACIVGVHLP